MEVIKQASLFLCAACVVSSVIMLFSPGGKYDKLIRIAVGAFVLCSIIGNVSCSKGSFSVNETSAESYGFEERAVSITADTISACLHNEIESLLEQEEIREKDISILMDISDDGSISIGQVRIVLESSDMLRADSLTGLIYSRLGVNAEIVTED